MEREAIWSYWWTTKLKSAFFFSFFFFAFPFCDFCVLVSPNFGGLCPSLPFEGKVDDEHTSV